MRISQIIAILFFGALVLIPFTPSTVAQRPNAKPVELKLTNGQATYNGVVEEVDEPYRDKKSFKILTIKLEKGKAYRIEHTSRAYQALLFLEDTDAEPLQENSSRNIGGNARIVFRPEKTGLYRLIVTSQGGVRTGAFVLTVARLTILDEMPPWFKEIDKDKVGQITLQQWRNAGRPLDEFDKLDLNGDGLITAEEILHTLKKKEELKLDHGEATYNGALEESSEPYRDKKSFKILTIALEKGKTYQIDHTSEAYQAFLFLEDADSQPLEENSSPTIGGNSRIVFHAKKDGTYRIVATSLGGFKTGAFVLSVVRAGVLPQLPPWFKALDADGIGQITLDAWRKAGRQPEEFDKYDLNGDGIVTAEEVLRALKKTIELKFSKGLARYIGDLEEANELYHGKKSYKIFTIKLEQGKNYQIDHVSPAYQAYLILENADGNPLLENSSRNIGGNSRLAFRAEKTATYRVVATSLGGFRTGGFVLSVIQTDALPKGLPPWFQALDTDGTGQITLEAWRKAGLPLEEFSLYDLNGDGLVTAEEVLHAVKKAVDLKLIDGHATYHGVVEEVPEMYRGKRSYKILTTKLEQGKTYQIDHISESYQAFLFVEDAHGEPLEENSSQSIGGNSRIVFRASKDGTYRIVATSLAGFRTGAFALSVARVDVLPEGLPPWFGEVDKDGDGQITMQEWRNADQPLDEFKKLDLNGDGIVTAEEVVRYLKHHARAETRGVPSWFKSLDTEGTGQITLEQWRKAGGLLEDFDKYDLNGDGIVTAEEVIHFLKQTVELKLAKGKATYNGVVEEANEPRRGKRSFKIFTIRLDEGKTYQIDHASEAYQAFLTLEDGDGNPVAENASPTIGGNSRMVFHAKKSGTYRLIVTSAGGFKTGAFSLSVKVDNLPEGLPPWFNDLDTDGDGQITLQEWRKAGKSMDEFDKYDLNGDGIITPEEVLRVLKKTGKAKPGNG
jgi:Ca2+-binding EF-hand superfamily protein